MAIEFAQAYIDWWRQTETNTNVTAHTARKIWRQSHLRLRPPKDHERTGVTNIGEFDIQARLFQQEVSYSTGRQCARRNGHEPTS